MQPRNIFLALAAFSFSLIPFKVTGAPQLANFKKPLLGQIPSNSEQLTLPSQYIIPLFAEYTNVEVWTEIAAIYNQIGQADKATQILSEVLQAVQKLKYCYHEDRAWCYSYKSSTLSGIAVQLAAAGQASKALEVAQIVDNEMDQNEVFLQMPAKLIQAGKLQDALKVAKNPKNRHRTTTLLGDGAIELLETGRVRETLEVAQLIQTVGNDEQLNKISLKLAQASHLSEAVEVAKMLKLKLGKTSLLSKLAVKLASKGQVNNASQILSQALEIAATIEENNAKAEALVEIAGGYMKIGEAEFADEIFNQAKETFKPQQSPVGNESNSSQLPAPSLSPVGSESNSSQLPAPAPSPVGSESNLWPRRSPSGPLQPPFSMLDTFCYFSDDFKDGRKVYPELLAEIALKYAETKQPDKAKQLLSQARQSVEILENDYLQARTLGYIAAKSARSGQAEFASQTLSQALESVQTLEDDSCKAKAMGDIAVELVSSGEEKQAFAIAHSLENKYQRSSVLEAVYSALRKTVIELAQAGKVKEALASTQIFNGDFWHTSLLNDIALELAQAGNAEDALAIAQTLEDNRNLLQKIAVLLAASGQNDEAKQAVQMIQDKDYQVAGFIKIANPLIRVGKANQASQILTEALTLAQKLDGYDRGRALRDIAVEFAEAGQFERALELANTIYEHDSKAWALTKIAAIYAKSGKAESASLILDKVQAIVGQI